MITSFIAADCAVFLCDENITFSPDLDLKKLLSTAGFRQWKKTEADIFELNGKTLVIARPLSPLKRRVKDSSPRLIRF